MQTILNPTISTGYSAVATRTSPWTRFMDYCKGQEKHRLLWLGVILAVHGCILTPMVAMITLVAGPSFTLFMVAMAAMGIALVTNLAAMPTKITIPAFVLSIIIDLAVVISSIAMLAS